MDLRVPPELEAKLNRLAEGTGRNAEQVALDLLATSVEYDGWFRREVEKGRTSARDGRLLDRTEILDRIEQRYRAWLRVRWTDDAAADLERISDYIPRRPSRSGSQSRARNPQPRAWPPAPAPRAGKPVAARTLRCRGD